MSEQNLSTKTGILEDNNRELVIVKDLYKHFPVRGGILRKIIDWIKAVDGVGFTIREGETLGLVGESGCGKSTIGRTILHLHEPTSGDVEFDGQNIFTLTKNELKTMRRNMQIIFQDPYASLNPRRPIGDSIKTGLNIHKIGTPKERIDMVMDTLSKVGLKPYHAHRYPHEFSGGQRQRIGIARAIALRPKFIVCDEPVSALDVSIQSQVLNLLQDLQDEFGLTYLFIAHNLSVVEHISDRVAVMYLGKLVEVADVAKMVAAPRHPYTLMLQASVLPPDPAATPTFQPPRGDPPSPISPPSGCSFHPRCPFADERCRREVPQLETKPSLESSHMVACHHVEGPLLPPSVRAG